MAHGPASAKLLSPAFVELVHAGLLRAFWRKKALRRFLMSSGISASFVGLLSDDSSKREWLDLLFPALLKTAEGRAYVVRIGHELAAMEDFPDLKSWEESASLLRDAREACGALRDYLHKDNLERAAEDARRSARQKAQSSIDRTVRLDAERVALRTSLFELVPRMGTQEAGYEFEDWFYRLIALFEIEHRRPYVHAGRQIDGSITILGTTYLVELKFRGTPSGGPDVDSLKAKVLSKADNTMGIMVAMSGYTDVAVGEASGPKTPILLLDQAHVVLAVDGALGFADLVARVRRHAAQTGEAYLPAARL